MTYEIDSVFGTDFLKDSEEVRPLEVLPPSLERELGTVTDLLMALQDA